MQPEWAEARSYLADGGILYRSSELQVGGAKARLWQRSNELPTLELIECGDSLLHLFALLEVAAYFALGKR